LTNPKGDMSCFSQSVSMTKRNNIVLLKNNRISGSERGKGAAKDRIRGSESGDERKRRKMSGGGGRLDGKDENHRGKDGTKRKEGEEE
jgi:hypothetical protein